jgi:DNA-binding transcriptional LysR family regulator
MKLELRQLRHVLALERYRNFARAAEAIGLTQPALSRSIQALEEEVGAKLFDRNRARVEPTAVGTRLIELAQPLISQAKFVEFELQQMVGLAGGLLRVGAGPYAAEISVGTAVGRLARQHPGILVDVAVADWPDLYRRLADDKLDVVIAEMSHATDDDRFVVEPLPEHRAVVYCRSGHPLTGLGDITLEDVKRYPVALPIMPRRLLDLFGKVDSAVKPDLPEGTATTEFRVEMPFLAHKVVMESDVLGLAVLRQIEHDVAMGRLAVLPLQAPWLNTYYGIIRLARRTPSPATVEFLKVLREVEAEIDAETNGFTSRAPAAP